VLLKFTFTSEGLHGKNYEISNQAFPFYEASKLCFFVLCFLYYFILVIYSVVLCKLNFNEMFFVKQEIYLHLHICLYGISRDSFVVVMLDTLSTNNSQQYGCVWFVTKL